VVGENTVADVGEKRRARFGSCDMDAVGVLCN